MNRLDGDAVGPVKVLVSNPLYSHDHQHVIIPREPWCWAKRRRLEPRASANNGAWLSHFTASLCRRLFRRSRPVSRPRPNRRGRTERQGQQSLPRNLRHLDRLGSDCRSRRDHAGRCTITTSGSQAFTNGTAASVSQSATSILDRFLQIPPTITIREGHRVKVYFTQDLLLPAYSNHTIPQTF